MMNYSKLEAENRIIGSLLLLPTVFDEFADLITADDFSDNFNQKIFRGIVTMIMLGQPVECFSVAEYLKLNNVEQARLINIRSNTPTAANAIYFAGLIKQASIDIQTALAIEQAKKLLEEQQDNRLDEIQKSFMAIAENKTTKPLLLNQFSSAVLQDIQGRVENKNTLVGLSTGFKGLDELTKGLKPSELIIIAGRPSMGKTLLGINIAEHVGITSQLPVAVFSLEMSKESLFERMLSSLSGIEIAKIQTGKLSSEEQIKLAETFATLNQSKILIDDNAPLTTLALRAKCRQIKRQHGLSLVVVDYLTLMAGDGENETLRIGNISRDLKSIAKELKVPVIAISQLNRGLENRTNKRPMMADLRSSGEIEQDADMILFIYRDAIYNKDSPYKNVAEIILAKNRNGAIGDINLTFHGDICRFDNYSGAPIIEMQPYKQKAWSGGFQYKSGRNNDD